METADHPTLQTPRLSAPTGPGGPRRPSRTAVTALAAAVVAMGVGVAGVALLDDGDGRVRSVGAPITAPTTRGTAATTTPPTTSAATAADASGETRAAVPATTAAPARPGTTVAKTPSQPHLSDASRLSLDGIGPVDVGMTLEQASAAAGVPIRFLSDRPVNAECDYARGETGPEGVAFMVVHGTIRRVDVGTYLPGMHPSEVRTVSGIGLRSTEDEVKRTYAGRIRVEPHPYRPDGHYLVYTPEDAAFRHLRMIFETDGERVTSFRAGFAEEVSWIEGCS